MARLTRDQRLVRFLRWHWQRLDQGGCRFVRLPMFDGDVGSIERDRNILWFHFRFRRVGINFGSETPSAQRHSVGFGAQRRRPHQLLA